LILHSNISFSYFNIEIVSYSWHLLPSLETSKVPLFVVSFHKSTFCDLGVNALFINKWLENTVCNFFDLITLILSDKSYCINFMVKLWIMCKTQPDQFLHFHLHKTGFKIKETFKNVLYKFSYVILHIQIADHILNCNYLYADMGTC